jgi:hypothetical protein
MPRPPRKKRSARTKRFVFLSHSGSDMWVAKQIGKAIEELGARPFLDGLNEEVGGDFEETILKFIEKSDELLVLMSPWAMQRPYVWSELGAAWGRRIPIVVLLYGMTAEEFQAKPGVPVFLKKQNLLDINSIDSYFTQLRRRIGES